MTSWPGCEIERLAEGGIRFSLTEPQISWVRIDYQARIQFGEAELVIETPFELTVMGKSHELDPNDRGGLGPLAALFPDTATEILMSKEGELGVTICEHCETLRASRPPVRGVVTRRLRLYPWGLLVQRQRAPYAAGLE
jgi:hypothetical protein